MGSPPPVGTQSGISMDKRYYLTVATGKVDERIQQLFDEYVTDLEKLRLKYLEKGLELEFKRAGWSRSIASVSPGGRRKKPRGAKK